MKKSGRALGFVKEVTKLGGEVGGAVHAGNAAAWRAGIKVVRSGIFHSG